MKKASIKILSVMVLALFLAACSTSGSTPTQAAGSGSSPSGTTVDVAITNFSFSPTTLTVKVGTTVTWTNQDSVAHDVTSDTGVFQSGRLEQGKSFSYTFNTAGTFPYKCTLHSDKMLGTIIVTN